MEKQEKMNDTMVYLRGVDAGIQAAKEHYRLELQKINIEDARMTPDMMDAMGAMSNAQLFMLGQMNVLAKIMEMIEKDWLKERYE